jgi:hypothetical protein
MLMLFLISRLSIVFITRLGSESSVGLSKDLNLI